MLHICKYVTTWHITQFSHYSRESSYIWQEIRGGDRLWTDSVNLQHPNLSNLLPLLSKMARQSWDLSSSSITFTTPHTLTYEMRVVTISAPGPYVYVSHQDGGVCLDQSKNFTAAWPLQSLIRTIMNCWRRLRLVYGLINNGHHNVLLSHGWGKSKNWLGLYYTFHTAWLSDFGLIQSIHCIPTFPISYHYYRKWLDEVEVWVHQVLPSSNPDLWVAGDDNFSSAGPYVLHHQDGVCLDWSKNFTAAWPLQYLIASILNCWRRLRLVYGL